MLEEKKVPRNLVGKVVHCVMLNVRTKPTVTSDVMTILMENSEVLIDPSFEDANREWYRIKTATGDYGYAMSTFIAIKE